ncbi:hypothetical protein SAMN05421771_1849 [Granulicella pectinivorans]|uniref:Uncharacterized protein n=2 Tax=Granulicella pectinivorans TaxID=474950 RepID=A0A1I6M586_9BACT|nr:hypothetical protein SAMN05421771_1849 [Granulicella pectinivorans]
MSKRDLLERYENACMAVICEYVRIRSLSPIIASQIDPEPTNQPQKLTFDLVGYAVDIEKATEKALEGRPDLQRNWFQLAFGEPVVAAPKKELFLRCGRLYIARNLAPSRYWLRDRYAHRRKP